MKTTWILPLALLSLGLAACQKTGTGSGSQAVVLDVTCAADADCPAGYACEAELEHGGLTSLCATHDEDAVASGECPAGFELEVEDGGVVYCKAHGGGGAGGSDDGSGGAGGDDGSAGAGGDDGSAGAGGDDGSAGAGGDDGGSGAGAAGAACQSNADCGAGLECETQLEGGVVTSTCQPHGGAP